MAHVEEHLQLSELEGRYRSASEATEARHFQVIWLLAKGHTVGEVSEMTSFGQRWLEQLLSRYNKLGPSSLGDRRRSNGSEATILKPEVLAVLKERLKKPPADGGLWSGPKAGGLDGGRTGLGDGGAATGLGGAEGSRVEFAGAQAEQPRGGERGRTPGV